MIKVAVGIIVRENKVLLCQRKKSSPYGLQWEFPGGKVEKGETIEACLRRELHEELGITAEVGGLFHQQFCEYPDAGQFDVFYYFVPKFKGEIKNRCFESYGWVSVYDLQQFDILEGNREAVQKLVELYVQIGSNTN
jgi:8-oxo-dGTP diphosphatase